MLNAHIDFETFSKLTIKGPKSVGSHKYSRHSSTEILCMAWAIGDEDPGLWLPGQPPPERLMEHVREGGLVWAWNAEFEIPIMENVCVTQLGWPEVPFEQWRDSAALALTFSLPASLEDCGKALKVDVQKDKRGKHLLNKLAKPRRPSKNDPATRWTYEAVPKDYVDLYQYCRQDVCAERAIQHQLPRADLTDSELKTWRMTLEMNASGWQVDIPSTERAIDLMGQYKIEALAELRALTSCQVQTAGQHDKLRRWLADQGHVFPNMQADTVDEVLLDSGLSRRVRRVLEIRQALSGAAVNKYYSQIRLADKEGVVRNLLMFHGANTGRDVGRGIQIQNYLRDSISKTEAGVELAIEVLHSEDPIPTIETLYGPVPKFAALLTRSMLTASPGMVLYSGDYKSIENRLSAWYAGCEYALGCFRKGLDEYKSFGSRYYHVDYDDVSSKQRDHSKRAVLSLMFGSGWRTFQKQAAKYGDPCSDEVAQDTVNFYRRELYPEVIEMWYDLEKAAMAAVDMPGRVTRVKKTYATVKFEYREDHGFLYMTLASGRRISFYKPRIEMCKTPWGKDQLGVTCESMSKAGWYRDQILPGTFFNYVIQGTARDIMMAGAHATIAIGYQLVGRVHDELISQRPKGTGDLGEYLLAMCPSLPWLQGVPILAEGWTGHRYRK